MSLARFFTRPQSWRHIPLGLRLTVALAALVALAIVAVSKATSGLAERAMNASAIERLEGLRDGRRAALLRFLETIEQDVSAIAGNPIAHDALVEFAAAWKDAGPQAATVIGRAFAGQATAEVPEFYAEIHQRHDGWIGRTIARSGYADAYLISPQGEVIYSVAKRGNFGANVATGTGGLARIFARLASGGATEAFVDFAADGTDAGDPAAYAAAPILGGSGELVGILAYRISVEVVPSFWTAWRPG